MSMTVCNYFYAFPASAIALRKQHWKVVSSHEHDQSKGATSKFDCTIQ